MTAANVWNDIDAIILAGGLGTRLRSALPDRPKVLAEVRGRPFLDIVLEQLAKAGLKRTVLALGYGAEAVMTHVAAHRNPDMDVIPSVEESPLGTGGAVRHALERTGAGTLLVLNGDSFAPADLGAFQAFHARVGGAPTLLAVPSDDVSRYGRLDIDPDGRVRKFVEKSRADAGRGYISGGIYLIGRSTIAALPSGTPVSIETEVFPALVEQGLWAMVQDVPFIDIGTPESWRAADRFFAMIGDREVR